MLRPQASARLTSPPPVLDFVFPRKQLVWGEISVHAIQSISCLILESVLNIVSVWSLESSGVAIGFRPANFSCDGCVKISFSLPTIAIDDGPAWQLIRRDLIKPNQKYQLWKHNQLCHPYIPKTSPVRALRGVAATPFRRSVRVACFPRLSRSRPSCTSFLNIRTVSRSSFVSSEPILRL